MEGGGPLQDLLGQLQFGSRVGLVGVLLGRQRRQQFSSAIRGWRRQLGSQEKDARAADRWGRVRELFRWLTWWESDTQQQRVCLPGQTERAERQEAGGFWFCLGGAAGGCAALCRKQIEER